MYQLFHFIFKSFKIIFNSNNYVYFIFEANSTKIIINSISQIIPIKFFFIIFQLLTYLSLSILNSWLEYISLLIFSAAIFDNYIMKNLNPIGINKII